MESPPTTRERLRSQDTVRRIRINLLAPVLRSTLQGYPPTGESRNSFGDAVDADMGTGGGRSAKFELNSWWQCGHSGHARRSTGRTNPPATAILVLIPAGGVYSTPGMSTSRGSILRLRAVTMFVNEGHIKSWSRTTIQRRSRCGWRRRG